MKTMPESSASIRTGVYGNFRNPFGLVYRMLRSGRRPACAALVREGLRLALTPVDLLMSLSERRRMAKAPTRQYPLILIVGSPRCGTTLVYQALARYCDVSSLTNLGSLFPRSTLTATDWFGRTSNGVPPAIESYYGQTARMCDPNDGFHVWNRWFGDDRYETMQSLPESSVDEMQRFFAAWTSIFPKPLVNKNNRNTECINMLSRILENTYFVVVRRDPLTAARSLIRARQEVQGDKNSSWGLRSRVAKGEHDSLEYVDDVCDQLAEIESKLTEQLSHVPLTHRIELCYEDFCDDPHAVLNQLESIIPGVQLKQSLIDAELRPFRRSPGAELSAAEEHRLAECLGRLTTC